MFQVLLGGVVGVASGMRHAVEPDHLAAVSSLVSGERSARSAMRFAAAWGLGHALMLLLVSGALVVTRREMPPLLVDTFEIVVAMMLVGLGVRAMRRKIQRARSAEHEHPHPHPHPHRRSSLTDLRRPLMVGLVHGLAGSGALTALTLATIGSPWAGLVYIALYGFGAMVGMALLAGVAGAPLSRFAQSERAMRALSAATGGASLAIGLVWGFQAISRLVA